jgi:hypothetical protein
MELDLNNLPPRLIAVIGSRNMAYVFRTLYETYSAPTAAAEPNNNINATIPTPKLLEAFNAYFDIIAVLSDII